MPALVENYWFQKELADTVTFAYSKDKKELSLHFKKRGSKKVSCMLKMRARDVHGKRYSVRGIIFHKEGDTRFERTFTRLELITAFYVPRMFCQTVDQPGYSSQFCADTAITGKFIRSGEMLNIPCPGSGNEGDPNISIALKPRLMEEMRKFITSNDRN